MTVTLPLGTLIAAAGMACAWGWVFCWLAVRYCATTAAADTPRNSTPRNRCPAGNGHERPGDARIDMPRPQYP